MDLSESTKVVLDRISKLEPDNVSKIIGYLLIQDQGEREMIRLAFSPDNQIQSFINKAKAELGLASKPVASPSVSPPQVNLAPNLDFPLQFTPFLPATPRPFSSLTPILVPNPYWDPQVPAEQQPVHNLEFLPAGYSESADGYRPQTQIQFLSLDDQLESVNHVRSDFASNYYFSDSAIGPRSNRRSPSLPEFPVKVCHYFSRGYCKHGSNCRYFHGHPMPESFSQMFTPNPHETVNEDHVFSPGSLEKLEMELTELLKSRKGYPVSIASLPMLYYEKYGRTLQAEGYLTESQRHGKAGYSLTKLLTRLKDSIRVIDRPHGQHSVVLAEDVPKYMEYNGERNEHGGIVAGSRQIYLTFPAESTFTEQDVSNYFSKFGHVQDVRIPCQQKRMFGFVTFVFPETVKKILAKGNPHFVCGARVLVKPYREKSRLLERKYSEKVQHLMYYGPQVGDADPELHPMPRVDNSRMLRKHFMEENEHAIEIERMRLSGMQLVAKHINHSSYGGYALDELKLSEEQPEFPSAETFNCLLDVLNNAPGTTAETVGHIKTKFNDQESSQGLNLPDSPFASPIAGGISTMT